MTRSDQTRPDQTLICGFLRGCKRIIRRFLPSKAIKIITHNIRRTILWREYIYLFTKKNGLEVGGPSDIFAPIYHCCSSCDDVNFSADTVWWTKDEANAYSYDGLRLGDVYIADAVNMSCLDDGRYDFVLSSNNLEHLANPLKALHEFTRVCRPGGVIVVLVPDKNYTFDHRREYTSFEHMLVDYENDTPETDLTHLPEILELHDLTMDTPAGDIENFRKRSQDNYNNRCLHQHVFCEDSLRKLFAHCGLEVIVSDKCRNDYRIIGRKN